MDDRRLDSNGKPLLRAHNLTMRFGRLRLFRNLSFQLEAGVRLAVTGRNGSGKSTLLRILAGVLEPDAGSVSLLLPGGEIPDEQRSLRCGFVAPYLNLYDDLTIRENLQFLTKARAMRHSAGEIDRVLAVVGLARRADDAVGTYSSGLKQRARFAVALVGDPALLLLDEPTSNLDSEGIEILSRLTADWQAAGKLLVVATNDRDEARVCERHLSIHDFA